MKTKKIVNIITSLIVSAALSSTFAVFNHCNNEAQKVFGMCDSEQSIEIKNELKPKRQLVNGPCWAFSAIAALETYLVKHNMYTGSLSEKDLLNWSHRSDGMGWNVSIKDGASGQVSDAYFTSGAGPVSETEVPYNVNDAFYDQNSRATPLFCVRGIKIVDSNVESIKEAWDSGKSISGIAEALGIDRKTVRKYLAKEDFNIGIPAEEKHASKLDPYKDEIWAMLD